MRRHELVEKMNSDYDSTGTRVLRPGDTVMGFGGRRGVIEQIISGVASIRITQSHRREDINRIIQRPLGELIKG